MIDSWQDNGNDDQSVKVKQEPRHSSREERARELSKSSRTRADSDRSDSRTVRDSRDKENDKRRSPERRRPRPPSPVRRRSPPTRPIRRNSPPRRQNSNNKPSFLEEITAQIPELREDMMRNSIGAQIKQANMASIYNANMNAMMMAGPSGMMPQMGMNYMSGPNFMPQGYPNGGFQPAIDGFNQPYAMNNFNNPIIPPGTMVINPMAQAAQMNPEPPMPVPAPVAAPVVSKQPRPSTSKEQPKKAKDPPKAPELQVVDIQQAKKKVRRLKFIEFVR